MVRLRTAKSDLVADQELRYALFGQVSLTNAGRSTGNQNLSINRSIRVIDNLTSID